MAENVSKPAAADPNVRVAGDRIVSANPPRDAELPHVIPLAQAETFTVRRGRRYRATITLGGFEQFAGNGRIAEELERYGFTDVVVAGSGRTRLAEATWNGPDTT